MLSMTILINHHTGKTIKWAGKPGKFVKYEAVDELVQTRLKRLSLLSKQEPLQTFQTCLVFRKANRDQASPEDVLEMLGPRSDN